MALVVAPTRRSARLQIPTIRDDIKDLTGFASAEFFQRDNKIFFTIEGDKARSELRFFHEWRVTNATEQKMLGLLELGPAAPGVLRYTWMQIHGGRRAGEPLLRLAWMHKKSIGGVTYRDALFAVVRLNTGHGAWRGVPREGGAKRRKGGWRRDAPASALADTTGTRGIKRSDALTASLPQLWCKCFGCPSACARVDFLTHPGCSVFFLVFPFSVISATGSVWSQMAVMCATCTSASAPTGPFRPKSP